MTHVTKPVDAIQYRLADYACNITFDNITPEAIRAAKARVVDALGALMGGFFGEPCRIARGLGATMPDPAGVAILGTRLKTAPDMAAYVNGLTARYVEMSDIYHWPGSYEGHASDVISPILAAAEHAHASGRDFITAVVLGYEIFLRISDVVGNENFDNTNFCGLAVAAASGKLFGLSREAMAHCIAMAVVPNNALRQVRLGHISMYKAAASGHAGRAGVFAALLARAGMEGPHLPFEGKAGWCDHVAERRFVLSAMGDLSTSFKILDTRIKHRAACGTVISSILAAEKIAPLRDFDNARQVTVDVYKKARDDVGSGEHRWSPQSREAADHSIPYVVAATLMDGTVTPRSFNDAHLWNPDLRALMQKIEVLEDPAFTAAYGRRPVEHRTRVTVVTASGERLSAESGGDADDLSSPKSDAQIEHKFRGFAEDLLGGKRVQSLLERLWNLEGMRDVATIAPDFVLD